MNNIAINLQKLRTSRGLTQEAVSEQLNIDVRRWKSYEYGTRNMPLQQLVSIAQYFNVTTDYILGLDPHEKPQAQEFQKATGLSESAIANISKFKSSNEVISCINQFLSSSEFIDAIGSIVIAKTPSISIPKEEDISEKSKQAEKLYKIATGKKKVITDERITLKGNNLKEWHLWQATQGISKLIDRIVKGDNEDGKR